MDRIDLEGRFAVVTGGAKGLVLAIAKRLLQSGVHVGIWEVQAEALEATQQTARRQRRRPARGTRR